MWLIFFVIALVAAIVLFIHINLELNALSKSVDTIVTDIRKHYGLE
jgi:hypothetical protein